MRIPTPMAVLACAALVCACERGPAPECQADAWSCSDDARTLTHCQAGTWQTRACAVEGRLCEAGECVEPWRWGSPTFGRCEGEPHATPESLRQKMVTYEAQARRLHLHPELKWIANVTLPCDGTDCSRAAPPEASAGYADVERFHTGENDGLWSALYLAAQAFRYGTTREPEALETIRLLLEGERIRMAVTGVPGVFTRQFIPPAGVPGVSCPEDLTRYIPDVEKDDNQWVRIGASGCVEVVEPGTLTWRTTEHCGLDAYAGYCWLDNVSRDEYAGHIYALAALVRLVDAPDVLEAAAEMLQQFGDHLVQHQLVIHDWDGRPTEHGWVFAMSLDSFPGFNAATAMSYLSIAAEGTGDPALRAFYEDCLLQKSGTRACLDHPSETPRPYTEYLPSHGLYVGRDDCLSNWNNISMHFSALHPLIWFERDPAVRAVLQRHLAEEVFDPPGASRPVAEQHNAWFNFIYAAHKPLGPGTDGPAFDAVEDAICMLRQFPASQASPDLECPPERCQETCLDRLGRPLGDYPREVHERCPATFLWWQNPYDLRGCSRDARTIRVPTDYLLAYWIGRYHGFIDEGM